MTDGKYEVTKDLHIFNCMYGQLKMSAGTVFEVAQGGRVGEADGVRFATEILRPCIGSIRKISR